MKITDMKNISVLYKDENVGIKQPFVVNIQNEVLQILAREGIYICSQCSGSGTFCSKCASTGFIKGEEC